jgi:hypothetical protein
MSRGNGFMHHNQTYGTKVQEEVTIEHSNDAIDDETMFMRKKLMCV